MNIIKEWGLHELATKGVGILASVAAAHAVTLTTNPDYARFWTNWGLSAPQVLDKNIFQSKVSFVLSTAWIMADHFFWQWLNKRGGQSLGSTPLETPK